uniref:ATP synthase subunit b, chloroplastic n=1 Tax=Triparma laevis TaxID=1534972 RepID=A0A0K2RW67_9STRA|nr:ATP synthase CF0, subunit B [Triparma laevis]BAS19059.1 ATP synthase CF0, subunit B [Triparma laevis]
MENFDQIFTLLAAEREIGLNTDILETGVLNILVLVGIIIYVGRDFLGSSLEQRQQEIIQSVQDAEERLTEANTRLSEAQKQLTQAQVIISEIRIETMNTKKVLLESDSTQANQELATRFGRALATLRSREQQVFSEIKQQIISLALKNVLSKVQTNLGPAKQATLIDKSIAKLGGQL